MMMALVVDGDRRRRQVLGELLTGADVSDVGATNVALEYLTKRAYQLAVIGDPDDAVDGLPLAVAVEARGLRVPVVLVASGDATRLRARGARSAADSTQSPRCWRGRASCSARIRGPTQWITCTAARPGWRAMAA